MKLLILATPLLALCACSAAPPQNTVQEVAANNMAADEVTEVADDSAAAPAGEAEPGTAANTAAGARPAH